MQRSDPWKLNERRMHAYAMHETRPWSIAKTCSHPVSAQNAVDFETKLETSRGVHWQRWTPPPPPCVRAWHHVTKNGALPPSSEPDWCTQVKIVSARWSTAEVSRMTAFLRCPRSASWPTCYCTATYRKTANGKTVETSGLGNRLLKTRWFPRWFCRR